jgi:WD40 repeat protein
MRTDIDPESGSTILTGSWRQEDQLQLWDYGSGQLINTLEWGSRCALYAAQFSDDGKRIAAGGSGSNELHVFDTNSLRCLGKASNLSGGVYSLDWCVALPPPRSMKSVSRAFQAILSLTRSCITYAGPRLAI